MLLLCNSMRPVILFISSLLFFFQSSKAQFQLIAESQNQVCKWYVKNTSADSHKMVSVSIRFFHQSGDIVFTPAISNPGGGKYQFTGSFSGDGNFNFKYKTIQILALGGVLQPGEQALLSTTENTGNTRDTIIAAGVTVYYSDTGQVYSAQVFPGGVSPCPSTSIFLSSGNTNAGIKEGSPSNYPVHTSECEPQLIAVVYDNNTLARKPVPGHIPHCAAGRLWTTFGHFEDYMIYYSFNITTDLGRRQFDTFVDAIPLMDYVAIVNKQMINMNHLNGVLNSMKKIGFGFTPFDTTTGYFNIIGKKGANPNEAVYNFCQDPHGVCFISLEHSMSAGDKTNAIRDYSTCYENIVQFLEIPVNMLTENSLSGIRVFPNPTEQQWNISGIDGPVSISIRDAAGREVLSVQAQNDLSISTESMHSGVYFLHISGSSGLNKRLSLFKQ